MADAIDKLNAEISRLRKQLTQTMFPATEGMAIERQIAALKLAIKVLEA